MKISSHGIKARSVFMVWVEGHTDRNGRACAHLHHLLLCLRWVGAASVLPSLSLFGLFVVLRVSLLLNHVM